MSNQPTRLLAPPSEWPYLTWALACYLVWIYLVPQRFAFSHGAGLLPHVGYWAYHPLHDGMSMADVKRICAELDAKGLR